MVNRAITKKFNYGRIKLSKSIKIILESNISVISKSLHKAFGKDFEVGKKKAGVIRLSFLL